MNFFRKKKEVTVGSLKENDVFTYGGVKFRVRIIRRRESKKDYLINCEVRNSDKFVYFNNCTLVEI